MKNKILWIVTFIPAIVTAVVLKIMPEQVPMHYDMSGNIDRWGSKYENFIFPVIIIGMTLFWCAFLAYFKKQVASAKKEKDRVEAENNGKLIYIVAVGMAVMFGCMHYMFLYMAYVEATVGMEKASLDSQMIINIMMALFMIVIGNMLPKAKPNAAVGIRTVWSMHNDLTWSKSNRFGGIAMVIAGALIIIEAIVIGGLASTFVMLGILMVYMVVVMVYSYKVYEKYK